MLDKHAISALLALLYSSLCVRGLAWAQSQTQAPGILQASNILNPNVSVIGWFQGEAGNRRVEEGKELPPPFQLKEAEIAFQSMVDPYTRADFFVAIEEGRVDLEEAYLTWFNLPYDLSLKAGKMKANFGKFNRTHRPETAFADRPLASEKYFGEGGLASVGGSLSWHIPNPWLFLNLDIEALIMPEAKAVPAFNKAKPTELLYLGRLGGYYDLTESANLTLGGSYALGTAGQEFDPGSLSSSTLKSQLYGLDLTFRWKNPRRSIYRSMLWQTEILWNRRDKTTTTLVNSMGLFSHLEYQFARRWRTGFRYDLSQSLTDSSTPENGGLIYLTFTPSEFSLISLQGRQAVLADSAKETLGFLKVTFNIGPHGAHPF